MHSVRMYLAAVACILAYLVRCQAGSEMNCVLPTVTSLTRAHVQSHRNQTGHWIAEVDIEHFLDRESKGGSEIPEPWEVDVEHSAKLCRGRNRVQGIKLVFTVKPARVGPDYRLFPGVGYYKFHLDATSWSRARQICEDEGAHLAIINSVEEADALTELYRAYPKLEGAKYQEWAWIGLYKNGTDGDFITIFDIPADLTGFNKWSSGATPKTPGILLRAVFHRTLKYFSYDTDSAVCAFICEQELW